MLKKKRLIEALCTSVLVLSITTSAIAANPFLRSEFELADGDLDIIKEAGAKLYNDSSRAVGDTELWRNEASGNYGSIELVLIHAYNEMPCRRLQHDIVLAGINQSYRFIIDRCQTEDGSWKLL